MEELLLKKEWWRIEHGLHIENDMGERGTMNYKSKEYFCCGFTKRITHPTKNRMRWNARCSYQTFDTYKEALIFSLERAETVNNEFNTQDQKNKLKFAKT